MPILSMPKSMPILMRRRGFYLRAMQGFLVPVGVSLGMVLGASSLGVAQPSRRSPQVQMRSADLAIKAQGSVLSLNGRSINASWIQWQTADGSPRYSLSETALPKVLGPQLLNTQNVALQPIEWFPTNATPIVQLPTQIVAPVRYLDVTTWAQQAGWQLKVVSSGTTSQLTLTTPVAKINNLRQGKQPGGDRLVVDLDRSTPWQLETQAGNTVLALEASIDPALIQRFKLGLATQIKTLTLEAAGNRTLLRLALNQPARISTLSNPPRLVIDVVPPSPIDREIAWTKGLIWQHKIVPVGTAQFPVMWLDIDPQQLSVRPILPNLTQLSGTAPLLTTALRSGAIAAVNGGFFNRNNQLPLGAIRLDGAWKSGPILNRGAVGWDAQGKARFDRLSIQDTVRLSNGTRLPLTTLNSAYVQAGIARYTPDWGGQYTSLSDNEIAVVLQNGQVLSQTALGAAGAAVAIAPQTELLILRANRTAAEQFPVGAKLTIDRQISPPQFEAFPYIVGGGPLLIQNRQIVLDALAEKFSAAFVQELAARSAIGTLPNGHWLIATVHQRVGGTGASLGEMAKLMQQLGATDALNLDGGSSTTLYLGGQIIDRAPQSAARVHEAIGVFLPSQTLP